MVLTTEAMPMPNNMSRDSCQGNRNNIQTTQYQQKVPPSSTSYYTVTIGVL